MARTYWPDPTPHPPPAWVIGASVLWAGAVGVAIARIAYWLYERLHP